MWYLRMFQVYAVKNSSSVPTPPGRAINASDNSNSSFGVQNTVRIIPSPENRRAIEYENIRHSVSCLTSIQQNDALQCPRPSLAITSLKIGSYLCTYRCFPNEMRLQSLRDGEDRSLIPSCLDLRPQEDSINIESLETFSLQ